MKYNLLFSLIAFPFLLAAQADTVVVELAKTSRLLFTMQDSTDLELLRDYDYDALFEDILHQLEMNNLPMHMTPHGDVTITMDEDPEARENEEDHDDADDAGEDSEDEDREYDDDHYPCSQTYFMVFDFGINNYTSPAGVNDEDPVYSVRPWGSWYVGVNAAEVFRLSDRVSFEGKVGLSVYNFKFDEDDILMTKTPESTVFGHDPRALEFTKSKLTVAHINLSLMPVLSLGSHDHEHHWRFNRHRHDIRIGLGPYVGYRLGSYNKLQYEEDDDKENERHRSNFHLNNLRYGIRFQLGIRNADFFFQYDLNELFRDNKGPRLNAYSFGFSF
jgi:hypothetical protein